MINEVKQSNYNKITRINGKVLDKEISTKKSINLVYIYIYCIPVLLLLRDGKSLLIKWLNYIIDKYS